MKYVSDFRSIIIWDGFPRAPVSADYCGGGEGGNAGKHAPEENGA